MTRHFLLVTFLASLAAGCASTTDLLRSERTAAPAPAAHSLIIVGVTAEDALRARYEAVFVAELERAGIRGIASSTLIPSLGGLTMPELRDHMNAGSGQAGAVLHIQLAGLVPTGTWMPNDIPPDAAPARRDVGGITVTINAPADNRPSGSGIAVELDANLYSLPDRHLVWTARTRTNEANSLEAVARSHARALIREMRGRGLLAPSR